VIFMNEKLYLVVLFWFIILILMIYCFRNMKLPKFVESIFVERSPVKIYSLTKISFKTSLISFILLASINIIIILFSSHLYSIANILVFTFIIILIVTISNIILFLSSIYTTAVYRYYLYIRGIENRSLKIKHILSTTAMIIVLSSIAYFIYLILEEIVEKTINFLFR
jgi:hypothetical protein